jgi:Peptidase family C25/CARDB
MKRIVLLFFLAAGFIAKAQVYNNEWIDYNKTYYKFKVGATGLYQISQTTLAGFGLGNAAAEDFQLWRNGKEIPVYTSSPTGALAANGYIEFWGEMNDGKPDNAIYRKPEYQLSDKWSLQTDTAAYFLTLNPAGGNLRLANTANNVAGNTLSPEPYFMYTAGNYFKNKINAGNAVDVIGEYLYSASYDIGENWSSGDIGGNKVLSYTVNNLFAYTGGPNAMLKYNASGNTIYYRKIGTKINGVIIDTMQRLDFFNYVKTSYPVPISILSSNTAKIDFTDITAFSNDRMVIAQSELIYPRQFNFGGAKSFPFTLAANAAGNYLEISGFNFGTKPPVLYDLTNGKRYTADISAAPLVKVVLEPSPVERNLVLVSQDASNVRSITNMVSRNFVNYNSPANQGDYLIISNPILYAGANGINPVEEYRLYRSTPAGGSYNAKIFEEQELVDQFAFGIKKNPLAIRNFVMYARATFTTPPAFVFLLGRGVTYNQYRTNESNPDADRLNVVPTFGNPASDNLLTSLPGTSQPLVPVGRLSAITANEVAVYLKKVKEYEQVQAFSSPLMQDKSWMKNVVHVVGASEPKLQTKLESFMAKYKEMITDTFFGANVYTFSKKSADAVQQLNSEELSSLFEQGISMISYFGHSSSSTLEFNLDNPERYKNTGKYPIFFALGCNAGSIFGFSQTRFQVNNTLSEKWVLEPDHGSIAFIASSHFGIVDYLDIYNTKNYNSIGRLNYGGSIGEDMMKTVQQIFEQQGPEDFYARVHTEETILHGDPAIKFNTHAKPDYVIEDPMVKVDPTFVSIAETSFKVHIQVMNMGKAINGNIVIETKRQYPDLTSAVVHRDTIPGVLYSDSLIVSIPIDPLKDKGLNKITVTIDADNTVDELYETNNTVTKEFHIYEDEARPVYPYNYAIINKQNIKLVASTADPLMEMKQYLLEIDTTALFNSSFKKSKSINSTGGVLEFDPGFTFTDSTVYYWRVASAVSTGSPKWNMASFIYLPNSEPGFNQSHYFQHLGSKGEGITLSDSRDWKFGMRTHNLFVKNAIFPTGASQESDFTVAVDGDPFIRSACVGHSIIFNVFDGKTFKPWINVDSLGKNLFLYGSGSANCQPGRKYNFEFSYMTAAARKKIMDFMDAIPNGAYVVARSTDYSNSNSYSSTWRGDTTLYGSSLYHKLLNAGFINIDSIDRPRAWIFVYQKASQNFHPESIFTQGIYDKVALTTNPIVPNNTGTITSPLFGPAKEWKNLYWRGNAMESTAGDISLVDVIGITKTGIENPLITGLDLSQQDFDISAISADSYPYVKLRMKNTDSATYTPYQLNYWRLTYSPVPEGAVAPNVLFQMKDSLELGEPLSFKLAFKNISEAAFDSLKIKIAVTDRNNITHLLPVTRQRPLIAGDTINVSYQIETKDFAGTNTLFVDINTDDDQPEQFHFNNFIYHDFVVRRDSLNPLLDVTFDGVHILNRDLVSSKPHIHITLKDDAKFLLLNDTSLITLQVRYPNGSIREFNFNNDSLRFTPPTAGTDNTASIDFSPYFLEDGDYELIVSGKDRTDNKAGVIEYRVGFQVINKPMISNMLNYPNPFTTSTAFVFTITGSEVPQNIKIQVMTITGKIVREITKQELGSLHIGRNITEFKWDGTDQYGQKLANGIYLYRVTTNLNGKSLDKYKAEGDKTDQYFNKGYGKMYLMR